MILQRDYGQYDFNFKGGVCVEVDCITQFKKMDYIFKLKNPYILARVNESWDIYVSICDYQSVLLV